jgi:hypothetical protein
MTSITKRIGITVVAGAAIAGLVLVYRSVGVSLTCVFAGGIAIAISGLIEALSEDDKRRKRLGAVNFLFALLVVIGGLQSALESTKTDQAIVRGIGSVSSELTEQDALCYVLFLKPARVDDFIELQIGNHGEHTVYDVEIRPVDLDVYDSLDWRVPMPHSEIRKAEHYHRIGTLGPHTVRQFATMTTHPDETTRRFNIWITTRHHVFVQLVRLTRLNGRWHPAIRVMRDDATEPVYEQVPSTHPRDANGRTVWDQ